MGKRTWTTLIALALAAQGCADAAISADTARVQDLAALQARVEQLEQAVALLTAASAEHAQALTDVATQLTAVEAQTADQAAALQTASAPLGRAWDADGELLGLVMLKKQRNVVTIDHPEYGPIDLDLDDEGAVEPLSSYITLYYSMPNCEGLPSVQSYNVLDANNGLSAGDVLVSKGFQWKVTNEKQSGSSMSINSTWTVSQGCVNEVVAIPGVFYKIEPISNIGTFPGPVTLD